MKKRLLTVSIVFALVLATLLAIPASADVSDAENFTDQCPTATLSGMGRSYLADYGDESYALTTFSQTPNTHTTSTTVYVGAKFWHYPVGSTPSAYRTTTRSTTSSGVSSGTARVTSSGISGIIFCVESAHTLSMTCNGRTYPQQTKWTCAGEPAMK